MSSYNTRVSRDAGRDPAPPGALEPALTVGSGSIDGLLDRTLDALSNASVVMRPRTLLREVVRAAVTVCGAARANFLSGLPGVEPVSVEAAPGLSALWKLDDAEDDDLASSGLTPVRIPVIIGGVQGLFTALLPFATVLPETRAALNLVAIHAGSVARQVELEARAARVERKAAREAHRAQAVASASRAFAEASLDIPRVLEAAARRIAESVGDLCVIRVFDDQMTNLEWLAHYHPDASVREHLRDALNVRPNMSGDPITGSIARSGNTLFVPSIENPTLRAALLDQYRPYVERFGLHSVMIAPLRARGRTIGTAFVCRDHGNDPYTNLDRETLQDVAGPAALAVDSARLFAASLETNAALESMLLGAPVAMALLDSGLRFLRLNDFMAQLVGLSRANLVGRALGEAFAGNPAQVELAVTVLESGRPVTEQPFERDGRSWLVNLYPVRLPAGQTIGVGVLGLDVTARLVAESAVKRLNADLEVRVRERTEELASANRALNAFARYVELAKPDSNGGELALAAVKIAREALGSDACAALFRRSSGTWRPAATDGPVPFATRRALVRGLPNGLAAANLSEASSEPIFLENWDGRSAGLPESSDFRAVAVLPVWVEGRAEALLVAGLLDSSRWHDHDRAVLASLGRALTLTFERDRAADRLQAQTAALAATNQEQEAFLYTVSHDLRAPLLSIQGMSELLGEAVRSSDVEESNFLLSRVNANVTRMDALLSGLLALSRAGRVAEPAANLDLSGEVQAILAELAPRITRHGVNVALPETWPALTYPRMALQQILANLLGNAVKFAGNGETEPRVRVAWRQAKGLLTLSVEDNGPGVPPEARERVFELFKKLNPAAEGTGVGLAIVRRLVERNGGQVWIESSDLGGTSVNVSFGCQRPE